MVKGAVHRAPQSFTLMPSYNTQVDHCDDWMDHAAYPDPVLRTAAHSRRLAINERNSDSRVLHQASERKVVIPTVEVNRAVAEHDRTTPFDFSQCGGVGFGGSTHLKFETDFTLPIGFCDQMRRVALDLEG